MRNTEVFKGCKLFSRKAVTIAIAGLKAIFRDPADYMYRSIEHF